MAIKLPLITDFLDHDVPIDLDGDFTVMLWVSPASIQNGSGPDYKTFWVLANAGYDKYVGVFTAPYPNANTIAIYATDGVDSGNSESNLNYIIVDNAYHLTITYDLSAQEVLFYINGTLVKTISSIDFTGVTSGIENIGNDQFGTATDLWFQNYRAWSKVLTADGIAAEIASNTAIDSSSLVADTSFSNTSDVSGWTVSGAPENYTTYDMKFISGISNQTYGTSLTIPYLPYRLVQNSKGTTFGELWYDFDAIAANNVVGAWAYCPNTTFNPILIPYTTEGNNVLGISGSGVPIQFPVEGGTTYKLQTRRALPSALESPIILHIDYSGDDTIEVGDIMDPDDTDGFPASIIRAGSGVITFKKPFPAGEQGDALDSGYVSMVAAFESGIPVYEYDPDLNEIARITSLAATSKFARASNGQNVFAIGVNGGPNSVLYTLDTSGNIGGTNWTLDISSIGTPGSNGAIAINNDGTVGYYTDNGDGVKAWDLVNDVALPELSPTVAGYKVTDILVQADDTIIIMYFKNSLTRDLFVNRVDSAGSVLHHFAFGSDHTAVAPRLSYSINNPDTFWVWTHTASIPGQTNFREMNVNTFAEDTNIPMVEFENGVSQEDKSPTPSARLGISFSCPFFQLRSSIIPPPPTNPLSGIYKIVPWSRKTNDTLYTSLDPIETEDRAIPNPFGDGPLIGN